MSIAGDRNRARLQSLVDGVLVLGPQTVHIDVTNACNTDCVTCWDHSPHLGSPRPAAWKRQRVDVAKTRALLDDIESLGGLEAIIVSGMGEPFTHPDIYALLADIKARGLHLTVITNLVAADVERVIAIGVDSLLVGVQGASEESYRAFHPSFRGAQWQLLSAQLARLRDSGVAVKHVQVICRHNAHELVAMVELAHATKAKQLNYKLASLADGTEAVRVTPAQRAQLLDDAHPHGVTAAQVRAAALGVVSNLDVLRAQLHAAEADAAATAPLADVGCFLGTSYARVTVDGTVLYCCNTDVKVGHVSEAPFSSLWRGPAWAALRRRMRDGAWLPSCVRCGKLNQNEKLSRRFRELFGDDVWARHAGRAPSPFSRAHVADARPSSAQAAGRLVVLP